MNTEKSKVSVVDSGVKSLKTRIREATSREEIRTLLEEGSLYLYASPETTRSWLREAQKNKNYS